MSENQWDTGISATNKPHDQWISISLDCYSPRIATVNVSKGLSFTVSKCVGIGRECGACNSLKTVSVSLCACESVCQSKQGAAYAGYLGGSIIRLDVQGGRSEGTKGEG